MLTSKNHLKKTNIVLIVLTSLCVIGAATTLSVPCWMSSTSMIGPIGTNLLATVTIALIVSVTYSIMKNR